MKKLVRIEHHEDKHKDIVMISWILGNLCNYRCSYCPPELNSGSSDWIDTESVFPFLEKVLAHYKESGKTLYFEFSGGEVTCDPDFITIVQWLKERNCWVGIISNGSQNLTYWEQLIPFLDHICISYHPEFSTREKFEALTTYIHDKVTTHVNIVMHQKYFDECCEVGIEIAKKLKNSSLSFQPVMKCLGFDTELVEYTPKQLERLKELDETVTIPWYKEVRTYRGLLNCTYDDGTTEVISATNLFADEQTCFTGWECAAGIELLTIFYNGDIYPCWGKEGEKKGKIGSIYDDSISFPKSTCTCDVPTCFDICDIMTTRRRCN